VQLRTAYLPVSSGHSAARANHVQVELDLS
jgi:hypothetical protein